MDFAEQIEELFIFLEHNLSKASYAAVLNIKKSYNNDFNILGSFIKDYLTLKNNYIECDNNNVFKNFVSYFKEKTSTIGEKSFINDIFYYSKYYLIMIFEKKFEFNLIDNEIIGYIETINLFYRIELYPYLLNKIEKFLNLKIDRNNFCSMLKSLVDVVVERDINSIGDKFDLILLDYEINKNILSKNQKLRRLVG